MEDRFLRGGQIAFMVNEYFRATGAHEAVLVDSDLFRITLHGDVLQVSDTEWDEILLLISEVPNDAILESLYQMRIRESDQLQTVLAMYEQEINQDHSKPSYQKLKTMNVEARNERIETGYWLRLEKRRMSTLKGRRILYTVVLCCSKTTDTK